MTSKKESAQIREVRRLLRGRSEEERLFHRLHSVVLVLSGSSASEAARKYGDSPRAVSYWVTRFRKMGVKGLRSEQRSGRPPLLTVEQRKRLKAFFKRENARAMDVTAKAVSQFIKREFGVKLTERHCFRILKRLKA